WGAGPGGGGAGADVAPGDVGPALTEGIDEATGRGREDEPEEREGGHDDGRGGDAEVEARSELREDGSDDAVTECDDEGRRDEDVDLLGQPPRLSLAVVVHRHRVSRNCSGRGRGRVLEASFRRYRSGTAPM